MTRTDQQTAFINELLSGTGHVALVARAGCGKTTTILDGVDEIAAANPHAEVIVAAYNKAIADEVKVKLIERGHTGRNVSAQTLHAMGFGLVRFAFNNPKVDGNKVRNIIRSYNDPVAEAYGSQAAKLVGYAKNMGVGFFADLPFGSLNTWYDIADHYDVNGFDTSEDMDAVIELAQRTYRASLAMTDVIDFDDMILFPLVKNLRVKFTKEFVFLDEAQDLSRVRQALARKFVNPRGGRLVVVGDDRQAIYGFSGADSSALPNMIRQLDATVMPLSMTWRCPKAVVRLAQTLVPDIEYAPNAPEGLVEYVADLPDTMTPGTDVILCRNTAPLIDLAYKLIRNKIPAKVEGRAIGEGLIVLAQRWKVKTIDALLNKLADYRDREQQKAMAKGNEQKSAEVDDKVTTLEEICKECLRQNLQQVGDVVEHINALFADDAKDVVTLATYHRSKGREWQHVFLFEHGSRCPSKAARQQWQKEQEDNLAYVAFTRAQHTLTFVC